MDIKELTKKLTPREMFIILLIGISAYFVVPLIMRVSDNHTQIEIMKIQNDVEKQVIRAVDSTKRDMWRKFKTYRDSMSYEVTVREAKIMVLEGD